MAKDAVDIKVLFHINGATEAFQAIEDAQAALNHALAMVRAITVESEVE